MWMKAGCISLLWLLPVNCLKCINKYVLKIQEIQFFMLLCFIFVLSGTSSATTFTGFFEDNSPSKLYVDIPLNLATASVVNLTYTDSCADPDNAEMGLYNEWESSIENCWYGSCRPMPWGPFPLAAGNWTVRLRCQNESYNPDTPVAYTLEQSIEVISSQFSEDSEPDATSEEAITLTSGKVFSGWIGYQGYSGLYTESNLHGTDDWDDYYFSLTAGTKIKIKLDYDQTLVNALGDRDISIETYRRVGNNLYNYTHFDFSNWWQLSGDTTDEFTIPQDGIYLFRVVGGHGSAPKTNFGSYQMSVIVNGGSIPGEVLVTIQEAAWRKELFQGQTVHFLKIDYEVENTYNVTKTLESVASVYAPLAKNVPDVTYYYDRIKLINEILDTKPCQYDEINWDQFCAGLSLNHGTCRYYLTSNRGPVGGRLISISAHSKKNFTELFPVSTTHYNSFDDSLQIIAVGLSDESGVQRYDCDTNGLSFWPVWSIIPALQPLLLGK